MFKPLFEAENYKPVQRKFQPTPGRGCHTSESNLLHRQGEVKNLKPGSVAETTRERIVVKGEETFVGTVHGIERIRTKRGTVMGLKDNMARVSKHGNRFVNANGYVDSRMDAADATQPSMSLPAKAHAKRRPRSSYTPLASSL